jgi:hypothetical protein
MSHQIKCTLRVYDENSSGLLSQFDEMIGRLYSVSSDAAIPNVEIEGLTTVGKEYILDAGSEEDCHRARHALRCNCPAPFEVMLHRSHWTVEELGH